MHLMTNAPDSDTKPPVTEPRTIAYVGLGIMGQPTAANLLRAGHTLRCYARRAASAQPLLEQGATLHATAAEAAQGAELAFTNVSDTRDVEEVVLSPGGLAEGLRPGSIVIDMSTIAPEAARKIGAQLRERDIGFIDAPVSGGQAGAQAGTLTFMCGGTEQDFKRALPVLQALGTSHTLVGDWGAGQVAKCANQILIGATINAVAESFRLARRMDVDPAKVRTAIAGGFAGSKVLEIHGQRMLDDNFTPGFKARLHLKDIDIAIACAKQYGVDLPSAVEFRQRLATVIEQGKGDLDSSVASVAYDN